MWGHDRTWLSKDDQDKARALRLTNADKGFRQPVQVMDGNYNRMPGVCPWWDQMKAHSGRVILRGHSGSASEAAMSPG